MTLEEAIREADGCLRSGEGVGLVYYVEEAARYDAKAAEALVILRKILGKTVA